MHRPAFVEETRNLRAGLSAYALLALIIALPVTISACGDGGHGDGADIGGGIGPYFEAGFSVQENSYTFGQTPSWTRDDDVLSQELDETGVLQVYRSALDGSNRECLTCGRLPGPNGFAEERPQGDWILFCTYGNQPQHFGNPCLGGYGSDLYVMQPDGSRITRLAADAQPNNGADYSVPGGTPYDTLHPYWSPDGNHVIWTRIVARPLAEGGQTWEILLGDFTAPEGEAPQLTNIRIVGPAFGVYETQQWAPDGSGFLFSAFGPRASPFQSAPPGWMHQQLYFMRLYGTGASPDNPLVTQISDDTPVYQEQAVFTPDMRAVIFMTNRSAPYGSWYNQVIAAAQRTGFDAPYPGSVGAPQFLADFADPAFSSDLYMVDIATHAVRPLTNFRRIIPEFHWNRDFTELLWTDVGPAPTRDFITRVGTFPTISSGDRRPSGTIPAPGLYGEPIDLQRIVADALARPASVARDLAQGRTDTQAIPPVVGSYVALWLQQLKQLGDAAGMNISAPIISAPGPSVTPTGLRR